MQKFVVVDLEANGLDVDVVDVHCIVTKPSDGDATAWVPSGVRDGAD